MLPTGMYKEEQDTLAWLCLAAASEALGRRALLLQRRRYK